MIRAIQSVSLSSRYKVRVILLHVLNFLKGFSNLGLSVSASRGLVKTILVVLLSFPEVSIQRLDCSDNRIHEAHLINDHLFFSDFLLLIILIEDGRPVAEAFVISLSIFCCGIVYSEEYLNELLE